MNLTKYFKSEACRYIFILNHTDGKVRCDNLGITEQHYYNKKLADEWYHNIKFTIEKSDDAIDVDEKEKALAKLQSLYENMTQE